MPKRITTSGIAHTSDATFRSWGQELSNGLQAVGLTKVSVTGEINWTTVTRPAVNTSAGFEVFYLDDSLHATAPIYFRVEYRTGGSADIPNWSIGIGTGVNTGTGALTGFTQSQLIVTRDDGAIGASSYTSLFTGGEGYIGVNFKSGAKFGGAMSIGHFFLSRFVDSAGNLLGSGYSYATHESWNGGQVYFRSAIFSSSSFIPSTGATNFNQIGSVYGQSTSLTNGQYQAARIPCCSPLYDHAYGILAVIDSEITGLTVFPATIQGGSKNFIALPIASGVQGATRSPMRMCWMWEGSDV